MLDKFGRIINTIRISVTDNCNLNCFYCVPDEEGHQSFKKILSFQEIYDIVKEVSSLGISRIKITGGEPLVRKNIETLIAMIKTIPEIKDLSITTNGVLLTSLALPLKNSGLDRINISLDTLDKKLFKEITRGGDLTTVINGIFEAKKYFCGKIKINTVLLKDKNENEIDDIKKFCKNNNFNFQLINQMDLTDEKTQSENLLKTDKPEDCSKCNRVRLTADGKFLPCLFSDIEIDIKHFKDIKDAFITCVDNKIEKGDKRVNPNMVAIGG